MRLLGARFRAPGADAEYPTNSRSGGAGGGATHFVVRILCKGPALRSCKE